MKTLIILLFSVASVSGFAQSTVPGEYPQASTRELTTEDVQELSLDELKLIRNEIFARYGYIFKTDQLKKHFESQSWYKGLSTDVTAKLTAVEKKNIDLIRSWEERVTKTGDFDTFYELFSSAVIKNDSKKIGYLVKTGGLYSTVEAFLDSYNYHRSEILDAVNGENYPDSDENQARLNFGEFYNGVQYKWIAFEKIGSCWYITVIGMAG